MQANNGFEKFPFPLFQFARDTAGAQDGFIFEELLEPGTAHWSGRVEKTGLMPRRGGRGF